MDIFVFTTVSYIWSLRRTKTGAAGCEVCVPGGKQCALWNSVSKFNRHLVVLTDIGLWPERIEKEEGTWFWEFTRASKALGREFKVKMTATDSMCGLPGSSRTMGMVYPENILVSLPSAADKDTFQVFVEGLHDKELPSGFAGLFKAPIESLPFDRLVLVCVHGSRDKRCGKAGPIALSAIKEEISKRGEEWSTRTVVAGSTHIGGHKYAATLVAYPGGEWFGQVTRKKVPTLVDFLVSGSTEALGRSGGALSTNFRGKSFEW